jgi:tetratricopeptide (TPR) repeat protein
MRTQHEMVRIAVRRAGMKAARLALLGLPVAGLAACSMEKKDDHADEAAQTSGAVSTVQPGSVTTVSQPTVATPVATAISTTANANVTYGDAERVFRSGDYSAAADMFEAYAGRVPTNPWGSYMLGISAWRAGDHSRAVAALERTVEIDATHQKALINLARVLLEQGNASDALDHAVKVVEMNPELGEGWRVLGNARADLRMTDAAMEAYRRAILVDHRDTWTMNNMGLLMIDEGRYADALGPLARATQLRPDVALFQNNLGVALERSGYIAQAADAFRAALAADTTYQKARVSLDRVAALPASSVEQSIVLSQVAQTFQDEVETWKGENVPVSSAETSEQVVPTEQIGPKPVELTEPAATAPVPVPPPGAPF